MVEMNHESKTIVSNENLVTFDERNGKFTCLEPELLARRILAENPEAVEAFGTVEEMVEYIREIMAANYLFESGSAKGSVLLWGLRFGKTSE
jgi:hypothetical protein